jgi:hypothetical protein
MKLVLTILAVVSVGAGQSLISASSTYPVSTAVQSAYPGIDFAGAYAKRLTVAEVHQITELPHSRMDIKEPIFAIHFTGPRLAEIRSGNPANGDHTVTEFKVGKERVLWRIIDGSVHQTIP